MTPGSLEMSKVCNLNPNHPVLLDLSRLRLTSEHLLYQNTKHRRPPLAVKCRIDESLIEASIRGLGTASDASFTVCGRNTVVEMRAPLTSPRKFTFF